MDFFRRHLSFLLLFFLFPTIQNGYSDHPIEVDPIVCVNIREAYWYPHASFLLWLKNCYFEDICVICLSLGMYFCRFEYRVGTFEGIVGSSVCFSLIHIITMFSGESLLVVGTRMLLSWLGGVIFGYSMVDGTILASQFMHISNNLISQLLFSIHHVEGFFILFYCLFLVECFLFRQKRTKSEYPVSSKHTKMHLTNQELI